MFIGVGTNRCFSSLKRNFLIDNFNRANSSSSPGKANTGHNWYTTGVGVWGIVDNRLKMLSGSGNGRCLVDFKLSNVQIRAIMTGDLSNQRIIFRYVDDSNEWFINGNTLVKRVNGTVTAVASLLTTPKSGDTISIVLRGPAIAVYVNETHQSTITDSTFQTATTFGLFSASPTTVGYFNYFSLEGM